jgi:hypothetical protein
MKIKNRRRQQRHRNATKQSLPPSVCSSDTSSELDSTDGTCTSGARRIVLFLLRLEQVREGELDEEIDCRAVMSRKRSVSEINEREVVAGREASKNGGRKGERVVSKGTKRTLVLLLPPQLVAQLLHLLS